MQYALVIQCTEERRPRLKVAIYTFLCRNIQLASVVQCLRSICLFHSVVSRLAILNDNGSVISSVSLRRTGRDISWMGVYFRPLATPLRRAVLGLSASTRTDWIEVYYLCRSNATSNLLQSTVCRELLEDRIFASSRSPPWLRVMLIVLAFYDLLQIVIDSLLIDFALLCISIHTTRIL